MCILQNIVLLLDILKTTEHSSIIQGVPGGKVSILWGHSIGHSKQKNFIWTCVLFRTVSVIEPFDCIVVWLGCPVLSFPPALLRHCLKHVNVCEASVGSCDGDIVGVLWKMPHIFTNADCADMLGTFWWLMQLNYLCKIFHILYYKLGFVW
jgi:hypothetical protein